MDRPSEALSISFFSAASIPLALPPIVARGLGWPQWGFGFKGVNERAGQWLLRLFEDNFQTHVSSDRRSLSRFFKSSKKATPKDEAASAGSVTPVNKKAKDEPRIRGWAFMDYYEEPTESGVIPLLVECNFRGRRNGEEGWVEE